ALPRPGAPAVPPGRGVPRGTPGTAVPGDAGDGPPDRVRPAADRRTVGPGRVRRAVPALAGHLGRGTADRSLSGAAARYRAAAGVHRRPRHRSRRAPIGAAAAGAASAAGPVVAGGGGDDPARPAGPGPR